MNGISLRPRTRRLTRCAGALVGGLLTLTWAGCTTLPAADDPTRPGVFANRDGQPLDKPFTEVLSWMFQRTWAGLPKPPSKFVSGYAFPVVHDAAGVAPARPGELSATWIGHATVLLRIDGVTVLTDPHFSERASAVQWAGPRRKVPLPYRLEELPHIDVVLISHNHYDHLDRATVRALQRQPGGPPVFAVPRGLEPWFRDQGIPTVESFSWGETRPLAGVAVTSVPARHWSGRTPFDRNRTGWTGYVVRAGRFSVYFAGDTGYGKDFVAIGEQFGALDLALVPVGAYEPRWFMADQHLDPREAVQVHREVRARRSIGIHWGTFELTDEPLDQPIGDLATALAEAGVLPADFVLLRHGETLRLP